MSFDLIAPHYRWMEPLLAGRKLQRCRTEHLRKVTNPGRILILGEGPGKFLVACRRQFPGVHITCVDASKRMLGLAERRLHALNLPLANTTFIHADALNYHAPPSTFDLIVTHFFLDCFRADELQRLIPKLVRAASPAAEWLVADFTIPPAGLPRLRARVIHRCMYAFFRRATQLSARAVTPPDDLLRSHHFTLRHRATSNLGLLQSDLWSRAG